jgi:hypothetical protein
VRYEVLGRSQSELGKIEKLIDSRLNRRRRLELPLTASFLRSIPSLFPAA